MEQEGVVILHGIFRTHRHMWKLEHFLQKHGYKTLNIHYPSTRLPIEGIIEHIHPPIEQFSGGVQKLHWIGYSMGALVVRAYIHKYVPEVTGRVVQLAPPNQGSEVADFFKNWWLYKKLYGPAGQQLVTRFSGAKDLFGQPRYQLGVIAGNRFLDPISALMIGKPNDGKVSIESTRFEGMKDHIVIPVTHTFFPQNKKTLEQTLHFLKEGTFKV